MKRIALLLLDFSISGDAQNLLSLLVCVCGGGFYASLLVTTIFRIRSVESSGGVDCRATVALDDINIVFIDKK